VEFWGVIAGLIGVIGLALRFFHRKNRERRESIKATEAEGKKGLSERDPSKITAFFNRIRRQR